MAILSLPSVVSDAFTASELSVVLSSVVYQMCVFSGPVALISIA